MTAGAFPLHMRPLSSWHGTSRVPCRPFSPPEGPRQWLRTRSSRMHPPDGQDVVAHGVLPATAGTGAFRLHPDQAVQAETSLLTGAFTQQLPGFGTCGHEPATMPTGCGLEAEDGAGCGSLLPETDAPGIAPGRKLAVCYIGTSRMLL